MSERYNCFWSIDFLPNRTEFFVADRYTKSDIYQGFDLHIPKNIAGVSDFLYSIGINIYNYKISETAVSTIFSGKGVLFDVFVGDSVRYMV